MAGRLTIAVVDPFSSGAVFASQCIDAGIDVVRVLSRLFPEQQLKFVPPGLNLAFVCTHIYDGRNTDDIVDALQRVGVSYVFPGSEPGVNLADTLSERLGVPTNGTALSPSRRDKVCMQQRLAECGLQQTRRLRVNSATSDLELQTFLQSVSVPPPSSDSPQFQLVVKPTCSCGTDNVAFAQTSDQVRCAVDAILGHSNQLGMLNSDAIIEEFVEGTEFIVDTVSSNGVHKAVAVWQYYKRTVHGRPFVYCGMRMRGSDSDCVNQLIDYSFAVLDALGIRHGPAHCEVIYRPHSTPYLVEVGARLHGVKGSFVAAADACVGYNQIGACLLMLADPNAFIALPQRPPPALHCCGMQIFLVSTVEGVVSALPHTESITSRPAFRCMNLISVGERVSRTVNGWNSPGVVTLLHADESIVQQDYEFILDLVMQPEFFTLAP